jgi:hypothetical protein
VHRALRIARAPIDPKRQTDIPLDAMVRRAFLEEFYPDDSSRAEDIILGFNLVSAVIVQVTPTERVLGVEISGRQRVRIAEGNTIWFGARFDALVVRSDVPGVLFVHDYKLGCAPRVRLDAACVSYVVAMGNLARFCKAYDMPLTEVVLEYRFLSEDGVAGCMTLHRQDVHLVWDELRSKSVAAYIDAETVYMPGEHCAWCPFRRECPGLPDEHDGDGSEAF